MQKTLKTSWIFIAFIFSISTHSVLAEKCEITLLRNKATTEALRHAHDRFMNQSEAIRTDSSKIPHALQAPPIISQNYYLSGGELKLWKGEMDEIYSPIYVEGVTGVVGRRYLGNVPNMDAETGYQVYENSRLAWNDGNGEWPQMTLLQRIERVEAFIKGMESKRTELIQLIMWEINKSEKLATAEVDRTIAFAKDTLQKARELQNQFKTERVIGNERFLLGRAPKGVAIVFAPYNYPFNETFTSLIHALVTGNVALIKPARFGVLLMKPLLELFKDNFPPGVVNFVYGDGRKVLKKINEVGGYEIMAYIGGEVGARNILQNNGAVQRTTALLGMGAKNMSVILDDADVEFAVKSNIEGCLTYGGQRCTAHKILFVQRAVAQKFLDQFTKAVDDLVVGTAFDKKATVTASPDPDWIKNQTELTQDALAKGARIANLSGNLTKNGIFSPTIIVGVTPEMKVYNKEQFGPVIPVVIFDEISEVLAWQKQSQYGQQVAIYGQEGSQRDRLIGSLQYLVSRVNVNGACRRSPDDIPFGARKDSGQWSSSLLDSFYAFTTDSVICINTNP